MKRQKLIVAMGDVVYERTPEGQAFYDIVFSDKSEKYLARKYSRPISEIRNARKHGRRIMGFKQGTR